MTEAQTPAKATLRQLNADGTPIDDTMIPVQFNPETLKVSYSNQVVTQQTPASNEDSSASTQATGSAKTTLALELWFDVTGERPSGLNFGDGGDETAVTKDVRRLTKQVSDMMRPPEGERVPKVVRFQWGTFMFDGLIESIEESLEYFSPEGVPLRASLSFSMVQQSLDMAFAELADDNAATGTDTPAPGTQPTAQTQAGETMQGFQQRTGLPRKTLKEKARQNGIENLRRLEPMQRIETAVRTAKQPRRALERTQQDWLEFAQERGLPTPPATPKLPDLPTTPNLPDIGL